MRFAFRVLILNPKTRKKPPLIPPFGGRVEDFCARTIRAKGLMFATKEEEIVI
jgi:hypothetical protein